MLLVYLPAQNLPLSINGNSFFQFFKPVEDA
jgi:hypothetical protein